jgi:hypothetical protein
MTAVIDDYFLPAYIEHALKERGKFRVTESARQDRPGIRHLQVDWDVLRIIGRELRHRRDELFRQVDLRDRAGLVKRLSGLDDLATEVGGPDSVLRREALWILPQLTGFSPAMMGILLDSFAEQVTGEIWKNVSSTLPPNRAAQGFVRTANGYARYYPGPLEISLPGLLARRRCYAPRAALPWPITGIPHVVANVAAGNAPGISLIQSLMAASVGAGSLGKNATAEPYLGPRFLAKLASLEKQKGRFPLSDLMPLVTFRGTEWPLLEELIHQGDHLQATGGLDSKKTIGGMVRRLRWRSLRDLRRRVSGHWHKVSFDAVANEYLSPEWIDVVAANVAFDNSMFNTQGCLSAQQVFVEGTEAEVLRFAGRFIEQMRALLQRLPKGDQPHARLRETYAWCENRSGFTILTSMSDLQLYPFFAAYDGEAKQFAVYNGLNRSIIIRRVTHLETELARLLGHGEKQDLLQSCGVAVPQERLLGIAEVLGRAGVNRITAAGNIWNMHLGGESWDGYMPPTDLISPQLGYWTTIAFHDPDEELLRAAALRDSKLPGR